MAIVRNAAAVVVRDDADGEVAATRARLLAARRALSQLEADGHGERFSEQADAASVAHFKENVRRKAAFDAEALQARAELVELRALAGGHASGGSGAGASGDRDEGVRAGGRVASLLSRAERAEAESRNLRDIVLRQKSIRGFWIAPKAAFLKKAAEVRELEAALLVMDASRHLPPIEADAAFIDSY